MDNFRNSVKNIMFVFLLLFVALITYIAYFQTFQANSIAEKEGKFVIDNDKLIHLRSISARNYLMQENR